MNPAIFASTCVLLPSYCEGAARYLREAASLESPVVAANVLSCRDVKVHALTSLLCAARGAKGVAENLLWIPAMDDIHL